MDGRRLALIIANDEYEHPGLSRLAAPAADARALAAVLGDAAVGDFDVQVVRNAPAHTVEGHIEDLFAESHTTDLIVLHFSGHGLKNDAGELFFAARNTRPDRLASTALSADFIQRCMRSARARSIVLFLDCCYGGAFGQGVAVRASGSANVLESFPAGRLGGGRGRAVITASSAMEYAFEGTRLADEHQQQPSVFTSSLVEGLASGEADRDEDGLVSLNELYDYVFDAVRAKNPNQTPSRDVELQGELYVARSSRRRIRPVPIPADLAAALKDHNMFTRLGAVVELRNRLRAEDPGVALGAHEALTEVAGSDIRYVADAAKEALSSSPAVGIPATDVGQPKEATDKAEPTVALPPQIGQRPSAASVPKPEGAAASPGGRPLWKAGGIMALTAGGLFLVGILLPFQYGTETYDQVRELLPALAILGGLAVTAGWLTLLPTRRLQGGVLLVGMAATGTWLLSDLVVRVRNDAVDLGVGFLFEVLAALLLLVTGAVVVPALRREGVIRFATPQSWDWTVSVVLALAAASALTLLALALETWASERTSSLQALWMALLAFALPLGAVLLSPAALGRWMLAGWSVAAMAPVLSTWAYRALSDEPSGGMPFLFLCLAGTLGLAPFLHRKERESRQSAAAQ